MISYFSKLVIQFNGETESGRVIKVHNKFILFETNGCSNISVNAHTLKMVQAVCMTVIKEVWTNVEKGERRVRARKAEGSMFLTICYVNCGKAFDLLLYICQINVRYLRSNKVISL